jgi:hypothetical protein
VTPSDTAQGMLNEGYDPNLIGALDLAGATDAQLQNLWDNYQPSDPGFTTAANNLLSSLIGSAVKTSYVPSQPIAPVVPAAAKPAVAVARSWWNQSSVLGISNQYLVAGGVGLLGLILLKRRR